MSVHQSHECFDIGACNGGLSIELARLGAIVHAVEPNPVAIRQYQFAREMMNEDLTIQFDSGTLFSMDRSHRYDVVLFLGLVYHFRYPQLVLDYLSNFNADKFFISSQTYDSSDLLMQNRKQATSMFYGAKHILAGFHPSRPLLKAMIEWAGFRNPHELVTPETGRDFKERRTDITNSAYFMADKGTESDYETLKDVYM